MPKDIRVLISEDDPYARDLMALLLTRDWRTQVVGEFDSRRDLYGLNELLERRVDLILVDTEVPAAPERPLKVIDLAQSHPRPPAILLTGTNVQQEWLEQLSQGAASGYVLKGEVLYSLAAAVAEAAHGRTVVTPGVYAHTSPSDLPSDTQVVDGRRRVFDFTPREAELVRLSIVFNLAVRDIADELVVSPAWASEVVSAVYRKLGLREILTGETPLEAHFDDEAVLARCREITRRTKITARDGRFRKAPWMSTLAFHLLTVPETRQLP